MKSSLLISFFVLCTHTYYQSPQNTKLVGGQCEGCEAIFEFGGKHLTATDTLADFYDDGPKLKLSGIVYNEDGKTPAKDVIIYIYHTNQEGIYPTQGDEKGWDRRHGYIRGWVKTNENGVYTFYTLKPATYPSRSEPAHIHMTILEPGGKYYWLHSVLFKGDPLLTKNHVNVNVRGGGTRILKLQRSEDILIGKRDIILGKNISNYMK